MTSDPVFPQEILDIIVEKVACSGDLAEIAEDAEDFTRSTLCSLSLASRSFLDRCRSHLFHTVVLFNKNDDLESYRDYFIQTSEILERESGPVSYIRYFELVTPPEEVDSVLHQNTTGWRLDELMAAIPRILGPLYTLESFRVRLERGMYAHYFPVNQFHGESRKALLHCFRRNPIKKIEMKSFIIPCTLFEYLPKSLEVLVLTDVRCWCGRDPRGVGWSCEDCDVRWEDVEAIRRQENICPPSMSIGGSSVSRDISFHAPCFFSRLSVLKWRVDGSASRENLSTLLAHTSQNVEELAIEYTTDTKTVSNYNVTMSSPPAQLPRLRKFALELPVFQSTNWGGIISPFTPLFVEIILAHLNHSCFANIERFTFFGESLIDEQLYVRGRDTDPAYKLVSRDYAGLREVDDLLADRGRFPNLNEVRLALHATMLAPDCWSDWPFRRPSLFGVDYPTLEYDDEVRERLERELRLAFVHTAGRVQQLEVGTERNY